MGTEKTRLSPCSAWALSFHVAYSPLVKSGAHYSARSEVSPAEESSGSANTVPLAFLSARERASPSPSN